MASRHKGPIYTSRIQWKMAADSERASKRVFALKSAGLKPIPFLYLQTPLKGSNPKQAFLFVKANTFSIFHTGIYDT